MYDDLHKIHLVLNKDATIVKLQSDIKGCVGSPTEFIGKNWFDTFINHSDLKSVKSEFKQLFVTFKEGEVSQFTNDIRCTNGENKLIVFTNTIKIINGEKIIACEGVERVELSQKGISDKDLLKLL